MGRSWSRTRPLAFALKDQSDEVWALSENGRVVAQYPVAVTQGKTLDVIGLRGYEADQLREQVAHTRETINQMYADQDSLRIIEHCPACQSKIADRSTFCVVHGIEYSRCRTCGHVYVERQPPLEALNKAYAEEEAYALDYVDPKQLEQRRSQITRPKLDWVLDVYRRHRRRDAKAVLDVGAGGGHFVSCCHSAGLDAEGIELSAAACKFAEGAFGIKLRHEDYLAASIVSGGFDLVTFWGILEFAPEPARLVSAARRHVSSDGMLIVEVPRADAFGTAIQMQYADSIWRHLAPSSHMNIFSDASLASLLHDNGFRPVAAWYFGMDFFEMLTQIVTELDDNSIVQRLGRLVAPMQHWLDKAEFNDDIVVAAVPQR